VLLSLQTQQDKIHKVAEEQQARSAIVRAMELLWAKLRMPIGETQWARECLHYHVKGARQGLTLVHFSAQPEPVLTEKKS
jgi:hypothetical protein